MVTNISIVLLVGICASIWLRWECAESCSFRFSEVPNVISLQRGCFLRHDPFVTTLLLMGFTTKVVLPYKVSSILETLMEGCYGSVGKVLAAQM